jgi:UDP-N-acetylglucosamine acyltransferase
MAAIDPTARVEPGAQIGQDVSIGPYCIIGKNAAIGDGCRLITHVHVTGHTTIGPRCVIYPFASLGTPPQSVKYRGGPTRLVVGAACDIRESVTMNIGTEADRGVTEVGERCFFMAGSHVGHDCQVGNDVTMANNAVLGGHVSVGDFAVFGGQAAIHQFVRIGEGAMIAGLSALAGDLIPYGFAIGQRAVLDGLNVIGMRRRGVARADIHRARRAYRTLFLEGGTFTQRLARAEADFANDPLAGKIISFIQNRKSRPLLMPADRGPAGDAEAS